MSSASNNPRDGLLGWFAGNPVAANLLMAAIVTLGIVIDDAVVVGEDIFHKISEGMSRQQAAIEGSGK